MDGKFWFRRPYRIAYTFYQNTLGKAALLMIYPLEYLKGIRKKTRTNIKIKTYPWKDAESREKATQLQSEIHLTTDMLVKWHRNKPLREYYKNRIRLLEHELEKAMRIKNENLA